MTQSNMPQLVLASSSAYRKQLLANIGIHVETCAPDIDETPEDGESPINLAKRLAAEKAKKVARLNPNKIIIGSDRLPSLIPGTVKKYWVNRIRLKMPLHNLPSAKEKPFLFIQR